MGGNLGVSGADVTKAMGKPTPRYPSTKAAPATGGGAGSDAVKKASSLAFLRAIKAGATGGGGITDRLNRAADQVNIGAFSPFAPVAAALELGSGMANQVEPGSGIVADTPTDAAYSAPIPKVILAGGGAGPAPSGTLASMAGVGAGAAPTVNPVLMAMAAKGKGLNQMVNMGGTSSYSSTRQKAVGNMPGYARAVDTIAGAQAGAIDAKANAESAKADRMASLWQKHQAMLADHQAKATEKAAKIEKKVADHDAKMATLRAELAEAKVDPNNYWSNKSTGKKVGLAFAIALSGIGRAIAGRDTSKNAVINMIDAAIEKDIAAQVFNINKKRGDLKDQQGIVALLFARLGNMRQATAQARIMYTEAFQAKAAQVEQQAASSIIRANAGMTKATLGMRTLEQKNRAWQATRDRVTTGSSGSSKKVPLWQLIQAQAAQQKKAGAKPLKEPTNATKDFAGSANVIRKSMIHFMHEFKKLKLPPGYTAWTGGDADAVNQLRKLTIDKVAVALGMQGAAFLELLKKQLGTKWSSNADVRYRVSNLAHAIDTLEEEKLTAEANYRDVRPLALRAIQQKRLFWAALGKGGGHKKKKGGH